MKLEPWSPIILAHAVTATACIVLGAFNIFRKIKGDRLHKAVGRTWASLMLFVASISFFIGGSKSFEQPLGIFLHALGAWAIISVSLGIHFAKKGNIPAHQGYIVGTYFGLLGATIGVVAFPTRRVPSYFRAEPLLMTIFTLSIVSLSVLIIQGFSVYISYKRTTPELPR